VELTVTQDEDDAVVVVTCGSFWFQGVRDLVCGAVVRSNRVRAGQVGCRGSWLVRSVALGLSEALGRNGLPGSWRAC